MCCRIGSKVIPLSGTGSNVGSPQATTVIRKRSVSFQNPALLPSTSSITSTTSNTSSSSSPKAVSGVTSGISSGVTSELLTTSNVDVVHSSTSSIKKLWSLDIDTTSSTGSSSSSGTQGSHKNNWHEFEEHLQRQFLSFNNEVNDSLDRIVNESVSAVESKYISASSESYIHMLSLASHDIGTVLYPVLIYCIAG